MDYVLHWPAVCVVAAFETGLRSTTSGAITAPRLIPSRKDDSACQIQIQIKIQNTKYKNTAITAPRSVPYMEKTTLLVKCKYNFKYRSKYKLNQYKCRNRCRSGLSDSNVPLLLIANNGCKENSKTIREARRFKNG